MWIRSLCESISCQVRWVRKNVSFLFALYKNSLVFTGAKLFRALPLYTSIPALFSSNRVNTFRDAVLRHVGLRQMYIMILKEKRSICLAMRAVAAACKKKQVPVLIHCIHGKDRTGLVVALTLLLCDCLLYTSPSPRD